MCRCQELYLATPLDRYEYMKMPVHLIPPEFIELNNLSSKIKNGYLYMEIRRGMYGLPQSGILANKLLKKRLEEEEKVARSVLTLNNVLIGSKRFIMSDNDDEG